jgi:hypothetical protein
MVNATPRPLYPREKDPVPIVQEAVWAPGLYMLTGKPKGNAALGKLTSIRKDNIKKIIKQWDEQVTLYSAAPE